jgi:hypothetical protein
MDKLGIDLLEKITESTDFLTFIKLYDALNKPQKEIIFGLFQYDKIAEHQFIKIFIECLLEFFERSKLKQFEDLDMMYDLSKYGYDKNLGNKILMEKTKSLYNSSFGEKILKVYPDPEKTNLYYIGKNKNLDKSVRKEANKLLKQMLKEKEFDAHRFDVVMKMIFSLNFKDLMNLYLSLIEYHELYSPNDPIFLDFKYCVQRKMRYMIAKFHRSIDFKVPKVINMTRAQMDQNTI